MPIVLRPTDWETSDLARLQCLPVGAQPITTWSNQDAALKNVAQGIRKIVKEQQRANPVGTDTPGAAAGRENVRLLAPRRWRVWCVAAVVCLAVVGMWYAWSQSHALATQGASWLDVGDDHRASLDFQRASRWNPFNQPRQGRRTGIANCARTP